MVDCSREYDVVIVGAGPAGLFAVSLSYPIIAPSTVAIITLTIMRISTEFRYINEISETSYIFL